MWDYAPPPAPARTLAMTQDFCKGVAEQDVDKSFDVPTQERIRARSFAQCMFLSALGNTT